MVRKGEKIEPGNRIWLVLVYNRDSGAGCRGIVSLTEMDGRTFLVQKKMQILSATISIFSENVSRYSYNDVKDGATTRSNSKKCLN